jgi:hypothetical protein
LVLESIFIYFIGNYGQDFREIDIKIPTIPPELMKLLSEFRRGNASNPDDKNISSLEMSDLLKSLESGLDVLEYTDKLSEERDGRTHTGESASG